MLAAPWMMGDIGHPCPRAATVANVASVIGDAAAVAEGAALACSLTPMFEVCNPAVPVFAAVGTAASVVEFGAGLAAAATGHVLAGGVGVLTLGFVEWPGCSIRISSCC